MKNTHKEEPAQLEDRPLGLARLLMFLVSISFTLLIGVIAGVQTGRWFLTLSPAVVLTLLLGGLIYLDGEDAKEKGWTESA